MQVRKRLGEMLIEAGVIDAGQLQTALAHQRKWGGKLGQALVDLKLASEPQIVAALSRKLGYEVVNVAALQRTPELDDALRMVPAEVALRHTVLPFAVDASSLSVVMSDPSNIAVVDELAFRTGRRIKISLSGDRLLNAALQRFYVVDEDRRRGVASRPGMPAGPAAPVIAAARPGGATPVPGSIRPVPAAIPPGAATVPVRSVPGSVVAAGSAAVAGAAVGVAMRLSPTPAPVGAPDVVARRDPPVVPERQLTPREAALLESIQRAARGEETALVKPPQLAAAVVRILLRKGLVTEAELIDELSRPT